MRAASLLFDLAYRRFIESFNLWVFSPRFFGHVLNLSNLLQRIIYPCLEG